MARNAATARLERIKQLAEDLVQANAINVTSRRAVAEVIKRDAEALLRILKVRKP